MKKVIFILCVVLISVAVQPVSALGNFNTIDPETISEYNTAEYQLQIQQYQMKIRTPYIRTRSLQGSYYIKLNVIDLVQENYYYCGPASIQMVLKYLQVNDSQLHIAQETGTTTNGSVVYKVKNTLNHYLPGDPYFYVNVNQVNFTNSLINSLQQNKPSIFLVRTGILPVYNNMDLGHYIVGTGYLVQWSLTGQTTKVWYNDSYLNPSYPNIYGQKTVDSAIMETAIKNNSGYIIVGN